MLSNDVARIEVGGAQYSCLCADDGGILDDLFSYLLGDGSYLTVSNAANHESDLARFREMQCRREPGIPGADHRDIAVLIPFETGPVAIEPPGAAGANRVFVGARFPQTFQSHLISGNGSQASRHSRPR